MTFASWLCVIQGLYYVVTGVWPLVSMRTFEAVTGEKVDDWLVKTVGVLVIVIGAVMLLAGLRSHVSLEVAVLAAGSALALMGIDVWYTARSHHPPDLLARRGWRSWSSLRGFPMRRPSSGLRPPSPRGRRRDHREPTSLRRGAVKARIHQGDKGRVVDEEPGAADEEIVVPGHFEIEDLAGRLAGHGHDLCRPAGHPQAIAGLQLPGHPPTAARLPEPVNVRGDDRFAILQRQPQDRGRRIVERREDRLEAEGAGVRVLGQDLIAGLELLDRRGSPTG